MWRVISKKLILLKKHKIPRVLSRVLGRLRKGKFVILRLRWLLRIHFWLVVSMVRVKMVKSTIMMDRLTRQRKSKQWTSQQIKNQHQNRNQFKPSLSFKNKNHQNQDHTKIKKSNNLNKKPKFHMNQHKTNHLITKLPRTISRLFYKLKLSLSKSKSNKFILFLIRLIKL